MSPPVTAASSTLAAPTPDALAASQALSERVAAAIRAAGGWIGFDTYMAMVLYEPGLGYYAGGSRKFGAAGDFITAPELSDLFGVCLAQQCAQWFESCAHRVIEFGAGSGALAVQVLGELDRLGYADTEYLIVEVSGELAARQRERLAREQPQALARVQWLSAWPAQIDGVVLANELLDAMPVRAFALPPGRAGENPVVMERGVTLSAASDRSAGIGFEWSLRPADLAFAGTVLERLAEGFGAEPLAGQAYDGEIGEQAQAWVTQAGQRLVRGAILLIDYGFARREFFHPQRSMGTLMCHYRHHAHGNPFYLPGLQDITAHVDFTAIAQAAESAGLPVLGYTSQARLLTNLGLLDALAQRHQAGAGAGDATGAPGQRLAWARQAQAAQALLSEAEMGELFKAIALGRGVPADPLGFMRGDRAAGLQPA
jgi:SAM-dependent MidA family methyltransferase